jgi:CRISP-associated protein Cas1
MAILYLTEQQSWVGREGECLIVHIPERDEQGKPLGKRERKMTVPLFKVEEVMVMGEITITTPALTRLLEARVPVTYLSKRGHYLGSLNPILTKNSILRLAQHNAYADGARRHGIAQHFVTGKLRNMRTIVMRYARQYPEQAMSEQVESLKRCIRAAEETRWNGVQAALETHEIDAESASIPVVPANNDGGVDNRMHGLGSLLGCEGAGSAAYFSLFGSLIKCNWPHGFNKRVRRPPTDPVNALLSYGYVILTSQVASIAAGVGFDPYIGYLHASRYGKPALALDLMEEFRPIIVDSVVLSLLNNRQLSAKDFIHELNSYRMTEDTRRLFLQKFEDRMQEVITHPVFEYKVTYRRCIELQARLLAKYLTGEVTEYTPFAVR